VTQVFLLANCLLSPNQPRQSTERSRRHWTQPVARPHSVFIYYRTQK